MPPEDTTSETPPEPNVEGTANEVAAVAEKKVEDSLDLDSIADRVAERVYDKIKAFTTDLVKGAQDVEEMVSESVAAKAEEVAPIEDTAPDEEAEEVAPRRSHKLFKKYGKKDD